jgi:acyl-CoA thioesterase I
MDMSPRGRTLARAAVIALGLLDASAAANGQVVALGASNTAGKGVSAQDAYPAQLEAMLRAKGFAVMVANAGVSGDTTAGMLTRLDSAVPQGTRVVILQPGGNDRGAPSSVPQILARLRAKGVKVVMVENSMLAAIPAPMHQPDRIHLTAEGYHLLAGRLLPRVASALGSSRR